MGMFCETGYHEQTGVCVDVNECSSHTCGYAGDVNALCVDKIAPEVGYVCMFLWLRRVWWCLCE